MSIPNQSIDPIYAVVTPIQYPDESGHATGFFFSTGESSNDGFNRSQTYLITNHHVIADENGDPISDSIRILTRPSRQDISLVNHHDISLHSGGDPSWIEHPEGGDIDVVAIPLNLDVDFDNIGTHYLTEENLKPDDILLKPGQEAMVIGYPIRGEFSVSSSE